MALTKKALPARRVGSLLAPIWPLVPEVMDTSCPASLSPLDTVPFRLRVPPLGRNTSAELAVTVPMAVEPTSPLGLAIPATLPSAVSSRTTWLPVLKLSVLSHAESSTSNSCPKAVSFSGALKLGLAFSSTQVRRRSETMRVLDRSS